MLDSLLQQIKQRRLTLGLKQKDMMMRIGVSRQQYQRLEAQGNPQLETLELIAKGLNSELMLIPKEKVEAVIFMLEQDESRHTPELKTRSQTKKRLSDDPWQDILEDEP